MAQKIKTKPAKATKSTVKAKAVAKPAKGGSKAAELQIAKAKAALEKEKVSAEVPVAPQPTKSQTTKSKSRKISVDVDPAEGSASLSGKWGTLYKKAEQIESKPYNMKAVFEEKTAIVHKVLGWGYILANRNDRLEVLFKDGIKYLISNYKP